METKIAEKLQVIHDRIETEGELINQIAAALEGKSLPNNTTQENLEEELNAQSILLEEQNAKITELAEALANKASGSPTLKTCNVTVNIDEGYPILGVRVENEIPVPFYSEDMNQDRTWETICGSIVAVSSSFPIEYNCTNATFIKEGLDYTANGTLHNSHQVKIFRIDAEEGETAVINIWEA